MAKAEPQYECRHILVNGTKCGAVALLASPWCFFHNRIHGQLAASRRRSTTPPAPGTDSTLDYGCIPVGPSNVAPPHAAPPHAAPETLPIDIPVIEDVSSIQLGINNVLQALAVNRIDTKRAGLMLYGLQIAQSAAAAQHNNPVHTLNTVDEVAYTPEGTPVAVVDPGHRSNGNLAYFSKKFNVPLINVCTLSSAALAPSHPKSPTEPGLASQLDKTPGKRLSDGDRLRHTLAKLATLQTASG